MPQMARRPFMKTTMGQPAKRVKGKGHQCPGSDIRILSRRVRLRMSEPKGHWQIYDSSVALTLTFLRRTRGRTERNVRVATLAINHAVATGTCHPFDAPLPRQRHR